MLILDLLVLIAYVLLGYAVGRVILSKRDRLLSAAISLPLGGGILTFITFICSWLGLPLTISLVGGCWLALILACVVLWRRSGKPMPHTGRTLGELRASEWLLALLIVAVVGSAALIAVGRSYAAFDGAVGWSLKGYGMFRDRTVQGASEWGNWGKAYPLNLPLQIGIFYGISQDALTSSKLLFPLYLLSILGVCIWYWRRNGVRLWIALAGALFLSTIRLVYYHATIGYANLPFTAYFVSGALLALEGLYGDRQEYQWLGGFLLALAAWTRPEGIVYVLVVSGIFLVHWVIRRQWQRPPLMWVMPIVIVFVIWFPFAFFEFQDNNLGSSLGSVIPGWREGRFNLYQLYFIPRLFVDRALSPTNMGVFIPSVLVLFVVGFIRWQWEVVRHAKATALLLASVGAAALPVFLFYIQSYTRMHDLREILVRSFDRAFMPATFMVIVVGVWLAAGNAVGVRKGSVDEPGSSNTIGQ